MAYVHEIKFFLQDEELYVALFDHPPAFCDEFWIKNIKAKELGIYKIPENVELEKKYKVEQLGIQPFPASKPIFNFIDVISKAAWTANEVRKLPFL